MFVPLRAFISVLNPGYDARTLLTITVAIPIITSFVYGLVKIFGRAFRWLAGVVAGAIVAIAVEAITKVMASRLDSTDERLAAIEDVLVEVDDRLGHLETRRRADRRPYNEEN